MRLCLQPMCSSDIIRAAMPEDAFLTEIHGSFPLPRLQPSFSFSPRHAQFQLSGRLLFEVSGLGSLVSGVRGMYMRECLVHVAERKSCNL